MGEAGRGDASGGDGPGGEMRREGMGGTRSGGGGGAGRAAATTLGERLEVGASDAFCFLFPFARKMSD